MTDLKTVTTTITNWLKNHATINEVTLGDVNEIDMTSQADFPLAHRQMDG